MELALGVPGQPASAGVPGEPDSVALLNVSDEVYGSHYNEGLIHQVVVAYQAAARQGTHCQKGRSEVRGGGRKPWKQKGTGHARAGSNRSPLWRGGGMIFPKKPASYLQKVNKKMYRAAMRSILSELVRQGRLIAVETFGVDTLKTRALSEKLKELQLSKVLIVIEGYDDNLYLAARNLPHVAVIDAISVDPVSLIGFEKVLMTVGAIRQLEERLA